LNENRPGGISELTVLGQKVASAYPEKLFAFISGSLVEGFGNGNSDLDVFVIVADGLPRPALNALATRFEADDYAIDIDFQDDLRTDTEIWEISKLMDAGKSISGCGLEDWATAAILDEKIIDLAHRIRIGVAVAGDDEFAAAQSAFDWERFHRVLCHRFLHDYNAQAEDAIGAIRADDFGSALIMSRIALGSGVDAMLASRGVTNPKAKWRYRKLLALDDRSLLERYLAAELEPDDEPSGILSRARDRVRLATELAEAAQLSLLGRTG
jgi:predicted nucleotidyltransferase